DKWITNPKRKENFFLFINQLNDDFGFDTHDLINDGDNRLFVADKLKLRFGSNIVDKLYEKEAFAMNNLRKENQLFISNDGSLQQKKGNTTVKDHTFHGED